MEWERESIEFLGRLDYRSAIIYQRPQGSRFDLSAYLIPILAVLVARPQWPDASGSSPI